MIRRGEAEDYDLTCLNEKTEVSMYDSATHAWGLKEPFASLVTNTCPLGVVDLRRLLLGDESRSAFCRFTS